MTQRPLRVPQQLKFVAYSLMIQGFLGMGATVAAATMGRVEWHFSVIGMPIGWGLLRLRPKAYTAAVFYTITFFFGCFFSLGFSFVAHEKVFLLKILTAPLPLKGKLFFGIFLWGINFLLTAWQFAVLHNPAVTAVFHRGEATTDVSR